MIQTDPVTQLFLFMAGIVAIGLVAGLILDLLEGGTKPKRQPPPRTPERSLWEGSAEQQMLHAQDDIRRWNEQPPY